MAGYKIGKMTSFANLESQLNEIGMSVAKSSGTTWVITFSDGTDVTVNGVMGEQGWFIADDDAKFLYMSKTQDISNAAEKDTYEYFTSLFYIVAQTIDGTMIGEVASSSSYPCLFTNTSKLTTQKNSDASKNDIILMPLVGDFSSAETKHIFKSLYINYHRWFSFGDIIVSSNGDRYIGIGWILHKIGGA